MEGLCYQTITIKGIKFITVYHTIVITFQDKISSNSLGRHAFIYYKDVAVLYENTHLRFWQHNGTRESLSRQLLFPSCLPRPRILRSLIASR